MSFATAPVLKILRTKIAFFDLTQHSGVRKEDLIKEIRDQLCKLTRGDLIRLYRCFVSEMINEKELSNDRMIIDLINTPNEFDIDKFYKNPNIIDFEKKTECFNPIRCPLLFQQEFSFQ